MKMVKGVKIPTTQTYSNTYKPEDTYTAHPRLRHTGYFLPCPSKSGNPSFPIFCSRHPTISFCSRHPL